MRLAKQKAKEYKAGKIAVPRIQSEAAATYAPGVEEVPQDVEQEDEDKVLMEEPEYRQVSDNEVMKMFREIILKHHAHKKLVEKSGTERQLTKKELLKIHQLTHCRPVSYLWPRIQRSRFGATKPDLEEAVEECDRCLGQQARMLRNKVSFGLPDGTRRDIDITEVNFVEGTGILSGTGRDKIVVEAQLISIRVICNNRGQFSAEEASGTNINAQALEFERELENDRTYDYRPPEYVTVSDSEAAALTIFDSDTEVVAVAVKTPNLQPHVGIVHRLLKEHIRKSHGRHPSLDWQARLCLVVKELNALAKAYPVVYWSPGLEDDVLHRCRAGLIAYAVYETLCTNAVRALLTTNLRFTTRPINTPIPGQLVFWNHKMDNGKRIIRRGHYVGPMGGTTHVVRTRGWPHRAELEDLCEKPTRLSNLTKAQAELFDIVTDVPLNAQLSMEFLNGRFALYDINPETELDLTGAEDQEGQYWELHEGVTKGEPCAFVKLTATRGSTIIMYRDDDSPYPRLLCMHYHNIHPVYVVSSPGLAPVYLRGWSRKMTNGSLEGGLWAQWVEPGTAITQHRLWLKL
jgi:hypothetical protein